MRHPLSRTGWPLPRALSAWVYGEGAGAIHRQIDRIKAQKERVRRKKMVRPSGHFLTNAKVFDWVFAVILTGKAIDIHPFKIG